ncbi:MAG: ROK family protein [Candidatus Saccharibacteria bacterium]|nr:ROK family protein [Candidatus Saccharibacteria bacterium]
MYLAIDIGGTKTLLASFTSDGKLKRSVKFKTPVLYDDFRDKLAINVEKLSTKKFTRCAVAIAGKVDRKQGVGVAFGSLTWTNVPIGADVKNIVGCEVLIENDCNVAGLYEAKHVSDKYKRVMYVTISTGIGGAIIQNGHIEKTTQDSEIGHMLFEHDGKLQRWEDFASGGAIVKKYDKLASEIDPKDSGKWYTIARWHRYWADRCHCYPYAGSYYFWRWRRGAL